MSSIKVRALALDIRTRVGARLSVADVVVVAGAINVRMFLL
jgi:hypothetical protein